MDVTVGTVFEMRFVDRLPGVVAHSTVIRDVWLRAKVVRLNRRCRYEIVLVDAADKPLDSRRYWTATPSWFDNPRHARPVAQ